MRSEIENSAMSILKEVRSSDKYEVENLHPNIREHSFEKKSSGQLFSIPKTPKDDSNWKERYLQEKQKSEEALEMLKKANESFHQENLTKKKLEIKEYEIEKIKLSYNKDISDLISENTSLKSNLVSHTSKENELMDTICSLQQDKSELEKSQQNLMKQLKNSNLENITSRNSNFNKNNLLSNLESSNAKSHYNKSYRGSVHPQQNNNQNEPNFSFLLEQSFDQLINDYSTNFHTHALKEDILKQLAEL